MKNFKKAMAQSLHGIIQNHSKFLYVSQSEALKYLEQDGWKRVWTLRNSLVCKIITPSSNKLDHCVIHYLDENQGYQVFSKEIYLNYSKHCFTIVSLKGEEKNFRSLDKLIHSIQKKAIDKRYWTKAWKSTDDPFTEKILNHPLFRQMNAKTAKKNLSTSENDVPIIIRYPTDKSPDRFVFHYYDRNEKQEKTLRFKIEREKNCFTIFALNKKEGKEIDLRSYASVQELVRSERSMIKKKLDLN